MWRLIAATVIGVLFVLAAGSHSIYAEEPDNPADGAPEVFVDEESSTPDPFDTVPPAPVPYPPENPGSPSGDGGASAVLDWLSKLDPRKWAIEALDALFTFVGNALLAAMRGFVDWGLGLGHSSNFVTRTPPEATYASPTVYSLWGFSRALANAALAVIVLWGGFNVVI